MKGEKKCNVHKAVDLLGKKWTILIIHQLCARPQGFNDLFHHIEGINPRALSNCLKEMLKHKLIIKQIDKTPAQQTTYSLTPRGAKLKTIIEQLGAWAAS